MISFIEVFLLAAIFWVLYAMLQLAGKGMKSDSLDDRRETAAASR